MKDFRHPGQLITNIKPNRDPGWKFHLSTNQTPFPKGINPTNLPETAQLWPELSRGAEQQLQWSCWLWESQDPGRLRLWRCSWSWLFTSFSREEWGSNQPQLAVTSSVDCWESCQSCLLQNLPKPWSHFCLSWAAPPPTGFLSMPFTMG